MSDSCGNAEKAAEYEQPDGQISPNSSDDGDEESSQTPFNGKRKIDLRQRKSMKSRVETSSSASSSISEGSSSDSEQGSESDSDSEKSRGHDVDKEHHVRFQVRESQKKELLLPRDMKQYLEECFTEFTPDKVLKEKILDQYPPPTLTKSMELDDYVVRVLAG